jgi:hypothetical protein
MDKAKTLRIKLKDGGFANFGDVLLPSQDDYLNWIAQKRKDKQPAWRFDVKCRQFAAVSTTVGAAITADCMVNGGFDAVVASHEKTSLNKLSRMYRLFLGRKEGKRDKRVSDTLFETPSNSQIELQIADEDLNRSGSVTHLHFSEADYIPDFQEAWRSLKPSLSRAYWALVVMETTLRRGVTSEFRDVLEEACRNQFPPWEVHFTPWYAIPTLRLDVFGAAKEKLYDELTDYEVTLLKKHRLSIEQVAWHRQERIGGMFGSLEAMQEAYPTTLEEALSTGFGGEFFRRDAMKFYRENTRLPQVRYLVTYDGLRVMDERDSVGQPHLEVWQPPAFGARYIIGADSADSEKRINVEGSECYAVVVNEDTGAIVAQWHGYSSAFDFGSVLYRMAQHYNNALVVPEVNYSGGAVIDTLRKTYGYANVYQRESFGKIIEVAKSVYGFDNHGHTRRILIDRLQRGINDRLFDIPAENLVKQLTDFGKRNGAAQKKQARGQTPDDGVIALALTTFGHRKLLDGVWRPKEAFIPSAIPRPEQAPARRGYLVSHDDRDRPRSVFNSRLNMWVKS